MDLISVFRHRFTLQLLGYVENNVYLWTMILLNQLQYLFPSKLIFQLITTWCDLVFKAIVFWTRLLIEDRLTCSIPFRWLCNMPRLWCVILTQLFQPRYRWSRHSWSHNSKFSIDCLTDCSILTWPEFNCNICKHWADYKHEGHKTDVAKKQFNNRIFVIVFRFYPWTTHGPPSSPSTQTALNTYLS